MILSQVITGHQLVYSAGMPQSPIIMFYFFKESRGKEMNRKMNAVFIVTVVLLLSIAVWSYGEGFQNSHISNELSIEEQSQMKGGCTQTFCRWRASTCWEVAYCGTDDNRCETGVKVCTGKAENWMCSSPFVGPGPTCVTDPPNQCPGLYSYQSGFCNTSSGYCKTGGNSDSCSDLNTGVCHEE